METKIFSTQFYSPKEIGMLLKLGRTSVYKLFRSPGFPAIKIEGSYRISKEAFEDWVKKNSGKEILFAA